MRVRVSCVISAVLVGVLVLSCASPPADERRVAHVGDTPRSVPELPRFESRPLRPLPHGSLARSGDSPHRVPTLQLAAAGARRIELKLLVITATGSEPAYLAARSALDRIGVPYDVLIATASGLVPSMLSDGVDHCYYRGIVVAVGGLGFFDTSTQLWTSAFTTDEWTVLADYERACSARELIWYGWPDSELGLELSSSFASTDTSIARITPAGAGVFPYVPASAAIPIHDAFGYLATIIDPTATTPLIQSDDGHVLAARHLELDGRETTIVTVDSNPSLVHSLVLEYGLVSWVSRGIFIGKKRAYLTPQVDDVFIEDDMWNAVTHRNAPELDGMDTFRLTGSDIDQLVGWQTGFRSRLPSGSQYITVMAFNGIGTRSSVYPDQTLLAESRSAGASLSWLNHTWDHENMDLMTRAAAGDEITRNCNQAATFLLNGFACSELVTPDMSGLTNPNAMLGILDAGARYVVSDTSITAEIAAERGTTPGDNPSFNVGRANAMDARVYQVPRHPTSIFYDVATRATEVDEYNTIYRSYWGRDLSYDEIIDVDTSFGLYYLLAGDIDPLMFHQPNLASELVDGTSHNLLGDWVEASAVRFAALIDAPILTLAQRELAGAMQARAALDACGAAATYVEAGPTLELRSSDSCGVPITGVASTAGTVDVYAGVPTTEVATTAGVTTVIPLP